MELDARKDIQKKVEEAIPNLLLDGVAIERRIALSYILSSTGDNMKYYIKLLCFNDKDKNCFHVRIQTNRNGVSTYLTKTEPKMVCDKVESF